MVQRAVFFPLFQKPMVQVVLPGHRPGLTVSSSLPTSINRETIEQPTPNNEITSVLRMENTLILPVGELKTIMKNQSSTSNFSKNDWVGVPKWRPGKKSPQFQVFVQHLKSAPWKRSNANWNSLRFLWKRCKLLPHLKIFHDYPTQTSLKFSKRDSVAI